MQPITPGRVTALWFLLRSLQKLGGRTERDELLSFASRSSLRGGGLPIRDGYQLAVRGGFIREVGGYSEPSDLGLETLAICAEDEPNTAVRGILLSTLLLREPPPWVAFWQGDPSTLEIIIPEAEKEMLEAAGLFPPENAKGLLEKAWWGALNNVPPPIETAADRKAIGDAGEALTFAFEKARLLDEGFPELAEKVRWVARESPAYGFDVASYFGNLNRSKPDEHLAIEVKTTSYPVAGVFPFHLTVHEFETAEELRNNYVFHFWHGVTLPPELAAKNKAPLVFPSAQVARHIALQPKCGGRCRWDSMYLEVPLPSLGNKESLNTRQ